MISEQISSLACILPRKYGTKSALSIDKDDKEDEETAFLLLTLSRSKQKMQKLGTHWRVRAIHL